MACKWQDRQGGHKYFEHTEEAQVTHVGVIKENFHMTSEEQFSKDRKGRGEG